MNSKQENGQIKKRRRTVVSCTECHRRKQKCDRSLPCSDCRLRRVPQKCKYLQSKPEQKPGSKSAIKAAASRLRRVMNGTEVIMTSESVAALADTGLSFEFDTAAQSPTGSQKTDSRSHEASPIMTHRRGYMFNTLPIPATVSAGLQNNNSLSSYDPFSILPDLQGEPLPKHLLIRYYVERMAPWLCHLDNRLRDLDDIYECPVPKIAWLGYAVEHTPFYYATLLTAAVHLNRRRKLKDPAALIWYKVQTMKLVNEKMNSVEEAATDEMIMTALILCYFNVSILPRHGMRDLADEVGGKVGGANVDEYEIHLRGINQMLEVRGGKEVTGMRGMVKNWLSISHGPWSPGFQYGAFAR